MNFSVIKMSRDEYAEGHLAVRVYVVTFLGIPIYKARFTSTNIDAIIKLTIRKNPSVHIGGFTSNK